MVAKYSVLASFCAVLLCHLVSLNVSADEVAATIDPATETSGGYPTGASVHGWEFIPESDLLVTQLGLFDYLSDGLGEAQWVGIFSIDQTLLSQVTVQAGKVDPLLDDFRYATIPPLHLTHGQSYVIATGGETGSDKTNRILIDFSSPPQFASSIEFVRARFDTGSAAQYQFPRGFGPDDPYSFGANFQFQVVPEPSTQFLAVIGAVALLVYRKWRR